jgi:DNA replication protein DnaC
LRVERRLHDVTNGEGWPREESTAGISNLQENLRSLFETFSQRYERASTLVTSNLPFDEGTEVFGSERLTGALLDRLTHHVHILEMNGDSYRLKQSRRKRNLPADR